MNKTAQVILSMEEVIWAVDAAKHSIEKWSGRDGYYDNRLASHLKGKLGELAVEKYLLANGFRLDSHFRFSERENLCDIVIKVKNYSQVRRIEIKTWSADYWSELGRCIAVDQHPVLKKKADFIIWCIVESFDDTWIESPAPLSVSLAGWSTIAEVSSAPIKDTGIGNMRRVKNYQLPEDALHPIVEFSGDIHARSHSK